MKKIKLDYSKIKSLPLYKRVKKELREQIINGKYEPGEKLPTEDELEEIFCVSKITVRRAMSELEGESIIIRSQGKGTFVADNIPFKEYKVFTGDIQSINTFLKDFKVNVLGMKETSAEDTRLPKNIKKFFNIKNKDKIGVIKLIRALEESPAFYSEIFLDKDLLRFFSIKNLTKQTPGKILKDTAKLSVGKGELTVEAIAADTFIAEILKCQADEPIILVQVVYWQSSGNPLIMINSYIRADKFKYKVSLEVKTFQDI